MIIEFIDTPDALAHDEFQAWRTGNQNGVFLTLETRTRANLHGARCQHLGSGPPYFASRDGFGSLTSKRKVCGSEVELLNWATENGAEVQRCQHCIRAGLVAEATGSILPSLEPPQKPTDSSISSLAPSQDDLNSTRMFSEGKVVSLLADRFERNPEARRVCLAHYGYACRACDITMSDLYGPLGENFIHVHHRVPLSDIREEYQLDPIRDLVPVCPNCHAMLHRSEIPITVAELAQTVRQHRQTTAQPAGG